MVIEFLAPGTPQNKKNVNADFLARSSKMKANVSGAVSDIKSMIADVQLLIGGVNGSGGVSAIGGIDSLRRILSFGPGLLPVPKTTASRKQEGVNQQALVDLIRHTTILEMARIISAKVFASLEEASTLRDEITGLLDTEASSTTDDDIFTQLMAVRRSVSTHIDQQASSLSRLETHTPVDVTNALVVSYKLYGQASRDQEIVDRNMIDLPGFISPNQPLQVLNV